MDDIGKDLAMRVQNPFDVSGMKRENHYQLKVALNEDKFSYLIGHFGLIEDELNTNLIDH